VELSLDAMALRGGLEKNRLRREFGVNPMNSRLKRVSLRSYRTDHPPNTVYGETREAIGGVENGQGYDKGFEEGYERCHGAHSVHPARHIAQS